MKPTIKKTYAEVVAIDTLDSGSFVLELNTVEGEDKTIIIQPAYYTKVFAKWCDEGSLVTVKEEIRIIGKTTYTTGGKTIIHGKNEDGSWKTDFDVRDGEVMVAFSGMSKCSSRLFDKKEKELAKVAAKKAATKAYDEHEDSGLAKVFADIELA